MSKEVSLPQACRIVGRGYQWVYSRLLSGELEGTPGRRTLLGRGSRVGGPLESRDPQGDDHGTDHEHNEPHRFGAEPRQPGGLMACSGKDDRGEPCRIAPPHGWQWCLDHLLNSPVVPLEERIEALIQVVDGKVKGATTSQQLEALDLLGQYGGLDDPELV
jgi:hypothetical protein